MAKTNKQSNSRSARCGRACDAIRDIAGELRTAAEEVDKMIEVLDEDTATIQTSERFISCPENVDDQVGELEELKDEVQSWFDNLPESLQQGDTGSRLEEAASNLESAIDTIGQAEFPKVPKGEVSRADLQTFREEAEAAADQLESGADEAEGTDFPGMYGK